MCQACECAIEHLTQIKLVGKNLCSDSEHGGNRGLLIGTGILPKRPGYFLVGLGDTAFDLMSLP